MAAIGLDLLHKVTVGDNLGRSAEVLETAPGRTQVVISTGGVGPTGDDVTRQAATRATWRAPAFASELMAWWPGTGP